VLKRKFYIIAETQKCINTLERLVSKVSKRASPEIKLRVAESLRKTATRLEKEAARV
jgi:hypothetical protein